MTASLPPDAFSSSAFLKLEDARLWPRNWVCIGAAQEIPNPGDLLPYTVGVHGIHVQRQADGSLVGRFNKAQHGGCHFIPVQCQTGKKTRCGFTSCGYSMDRAAIPADPSGETVPQMYQYLGMRPDRLGTIHTHQAAGLLFVSLASEPGDPPGFPDLPSNARPAVWKTVDLNWKQAGARLSAAEQATWHFPNLVVLCGQAATCAIILQPTAPSRTTCRIVAMTAGLDHDQGEDSVRHVERLLGNATPSAQKPPPEFAARLMARLAAGEPTASHRRQTTAYPLNPRFDFVA